MKQLDCKTPEEAAAQLRYFRSYKPYEYGGKWFLAVCADCVYAVRTKKAAFNKSSSVFLFGG